MSAYAAKLIYGLGLLLLAAGAVMPHPELHTFTQSDEPPELTTEDRLARAIHERIALEAAGADADLAQLRAEEDGLRRLAFEDDAPASRVQLIDALADALSAAMLARSTLVGGDNAEALDQAQAVVRSLTAAINAEVRGLDT